MQVDKIQDVEMYEPLRLRHAEVLYDGEDGFIMLEKKGQIIMASMWDAAHFIRLCKELKLFRYTLFDVKQEVLAEQLVSCGMRMMFVCRQAVYDRKESLPLVLPTHVHIELLEAKHADFVRAHYHQSEDPTYIDERIEANEVWGLFEKNMLAGFIGMHEEGSMGILEVLPAHQRKGYGWMLEAFLINRLLREGRIPFAQIFTDNTASLALQKKLGMTLSKRCSYWLCH